MVNQEVKTLVDGKIAGKKVMIFSKTHCPYCVKAKDVMKKHFGKDLKEEDYEVLEIENLPECQEIQDYLKTLTGARSVPRVFINQKFLGGGDEVVAAEKSGQLSKLLA